MNIYNCTMLVDDIYNNLEHLWDSRRASRSKLFIETAVPFFTELNDGKEFTKDELKNHPYYEYIKDGWKNNKDSIAMDIITDSVNLYKDIKENGMINPIDFWISRGKLNLSRGARRIVIVKLLNYEEVPVRIYRNEQLIKDEVKYSNTRS